MNQTRVQLEQAPRFSHANTAGQIAVPAGQPSSGTASCYELRFRSLFNEGRGYTFPCDVNGIVDLDTLGERSRNSYFYAHTLIGREFAMPIVRRCPVH